MSAVLTISIEGKAFVRDDQADEPRIRDEDFAMWLGFSRPRDIRKIIARSLKDGLLNDIDVCATVAQSERLDKRGRRVGPKGVEYWLTHAGAVKVAAKSEGPRANAILSEVVRVWDLVRREMLKLERPTLPAASDPVLDELRRNPEFMHPRAELRDDPLELGRLCNLIRAAAKLQGVTWFALHGEILRTHQVRSYKRLPVYAVPLVEQRLFAYLDGTARFESRRRRPRLLAAGEDRQIELPLPR